MMPASFIVDAHLDLAYNALRGRDVLVAAAEQRPTDDDGAPTAGLPDLHAGSVGLGCATGFCRPERPRGPGYRSAEEAHAIARAQLAWYRAHVETGHFRIVRTRDELPLDVA